MRALLIAAALCAAPGAAMADASMDQFLRHDQFVDVKLSPDGKYIAASMMTSADAGVLVILDRATLKPTGTMRLRGRTFVNDFDWANNERIVLTIAESQGSETNPAATGEIYATNWDGTRQELLIGPRAGNDGRPTRRPRGIEGASIIDTLPNDDKNILVNVYPVGNDEGTYPKVERLNIYTGNRSVLSRAPVLNAQFLTDGRQQVRFAWAGGVATGSTAKLYYRKDNDAEWKLVNDESASGVAIWPTAFTADFKQAYLVADEKEGPDTVYLWDPETDTRTKVARDDNVDPLGVLSNRLGVGYGVVFMDGEPRIENFDKTSPDAITLSTLLNSFPDRWVTITSYTADGKELTFRTWSDKDPGTYYLLDRDRKATYMLGVRDWIDKDKMADKQPIQFKARDGLTIHGYLTVPPGSDGKNLPMIVNVHGGPFGPYDSWGFDWEVQLLASRGYAVLQPNFRGSGNYGRQFTKLGYQQWGGTMQDDVTDATLWAIEQGIADKDRICIYGGSYGGYAAGMGIAKEPDLYRCAVGYVGVYDLGMLYTRGDIGQRDSGERFLAEAVGGGRENLNSRSPNKLVDRIKAPILLVAGGEDFRAPPEHSEVFHKSLQRAGKTSELMIDDDEGHGFYKLDSRQAFYGRMLAWFDRYIGPKSEAASAAASAP
ncbi:MAG: S9 family peptidase [Xanthomonadaceae bacterium]|jgi:dipeptidyl aminopeptidase/acylaminoacyl peptidase|nr:S9 family peptidase [Xanthomonadaceae bacterium]